MDKDEIIKQVERIKLERRKSSQLVFISEAKEFIRVYAGKDTEFYKMLELPIQNWNHYETRVENVLDSFINYVKNDLLRKVSPEREIQIDTVSDYLDQAENLLNNKKVHPAAAAVIIGASLEEFCRNWLEERGEDLSRTKMTLDSYSKELRAKNLITKQDSKDITSWGGLRNSAAHGKWEEIDNREMIKLMLQGVNLFMRKYGQII